MCCRARAGRAPGAVLPVRSRSPGAPHGGVRPGPAGAHERGAGEGGAGGGDQGLRGARKRAADGGGSGQRLQRHGQDAAVSPARGHPDPAGRDQSLRLQQRRRRGPEVRPVDQVLRVPGPRDCQHVGQA